MTVLMCWPVHPYRAKRWRRVVFAADLLWLALAAYGSYAINAAQYIRKLRMARLQKQPSSTSMPDTGAQAST